MIERSLVEALHKAQKGSKQELQAEALMAVLNAFRADGFQDIPLQTPEAPVEIKPILQEYRPFTDQERKALIEDGAVILSLTGQTIEDQIKAGRLFGCVVAGGDGLLKLLSINTQVAIYPDPEKFFIPDSGNRDLSTQEKLAEKDGQELRKRLGLKDDGLGVIIPDQVSTLTELFFNYLDKTTKEGKGVWLFGQDYSYLYGRTNNPINDVGSDVAIVGNARPEYGVCVGGSDLAFGFFGNIRVVRLVVAKKK